MRDFDLNLLDRLDALLRLRSVTQAAAEIGVSQPTMSGILAKLRRQLGNQLLVRVGRGWELTPYAAGLAPEIRQLLLRIHELRRPETEFVPARMARHFRIMVSEYGLCLVLPEVVRRVLEETPHVTLEAIPIDRPPVSVYAGVADLCLTGDTLGDISGDVAAQVRTQKVMQDRLVGIVDQAHPLSGTVTLEELLVHPHVSTQFPGSRLTVADLGVNDLSIRRPPTLRAGTFLALGQILRGTKAIGFVPSRLVRLVLESCHLRVLTLPAEFKPIDLRLLWHGRHDEDPEHGWLRGVVTEVCRKIRESGS
jgi:DNA-binding transcriptional LysR family regulator